MHKNVVCPTCKQTYQNSTVTRTSSLDERTPASWNEKGGIVPEVLYKGYTCSNGHSFKLKASEP